MMRRCAVVFIVCFGISSFAQEPAAASANAVFSKAVRLYNAGAYDSTVATVREYLNGHGKSAEAEYLVPLIMEALIRKGDYIYVNRLFDLYVKKFESSAFMPRVYFLQGSAQAKERSFAGAFGSFSRALERGVSPDLDSTIMKSVETVCSAALDNNALHDIGNDTENQSRIRETARYFEIKKLLASGEIGRAKTCLADFKEAYPHSRFEIQINGLLAAAQSKKLIAVGLLAPLSGDDVDVGRRVTQGFRLAIDKYNMLHPLQISVIVYDTRGTLMETVRKTAQLIDSDRVPLIIGPMLSTTATAAAGMLRGKNAVMVTPTATDDGIAEIGANIFQTNVTLGVLARKLARYAITNLNIHEFATVAPRTAYGASMSAIFKDEVLKNGGTLFDEESFDEGGNDFTAQFTNLRRKLLLRKIDLAAKNAGTGYKPVTAITPEDSAKWADTSVSTGAIFLPAETDDVVMLAPQVAFNRIKAQLLGANGWHSAKTIADGKQYVCNAIITTPFEPDSTWKKWPDFRKEYNARFREEPDRVAALGFDAGTIVAAALENAGDAPNVQRIAEYIASVQKFEGASGVISIDRNTRTNSEAVIMKITPTGFVRVQ